MTKPSKFVGLHAHTVKSVNDGFGNADEHFEFAFNNGMDAMAITDHGNICALPEGVQKINEMTSKGKKFKGIFGVEAYYHPSLKDWSAAKASRDQSRKDEKEASKSKKKIDLDDDNDPGVAVEDEETSKRIDKFLDPVNRRHHLVVLPKSRKGLENIFKMVSRSGREGYYRFPRIDAAMLKEHGEDVIVSTACVAGFPSFATYSQFPGKTFDELTPDLLDQPGAKEKVMRAVGNEFDILCDAIGRENVFAEIQFNSLAPQHLTNRVLIEYAKNNGIKLVAAADSHYSSPDLWRAREVYKLLGRMGRGGKDITPESIPSDIKQLKCELYPKNADQMWDSYKDYCASYVFYDDAIVKEAIENSWHIAHDVIGEVSVDSRVKLPSFGGIPGLTPFQTLVELCKEGMRNKLLSKKPVYVERLKSELSVIRQLENATYFLSLKALVDCAKKGSFLGPGRGSAAASLVVWLLGITDLDPVKDGLIFSRFMSLARAKNDIPDIDLDWSDRDHVINLLKDEFGEKKIIPITNFNGLQIKSLVKDISKLHSVPYEESNDATKNLDYEVKPHLQTGDETKGAVELTYEGCMQYSPAFKKFMTSHPEVEDDVKIIGKQIKALGKHAGGVVVLDDPDSVMPLISVRGVMQTPWSEGANSKSLSMFGFCKYDFLALKTLRIFESCITRILKRSVPRNGIVNIELSNQKRMILHGTDIVKTQRGKLEASQLEVDDVIDKNSIVKIGRHHASKNPSFEAIQAFYYDVLSPANIDASDEKVFDKVFRGSNFAGIFQFTNPATQKFVKDLDPRNVGDVAAATAIYRPGPLAAHVDKEYVKARREGTRKLYGHPLVDDVLSETLGFVIYQESIQKVAMSLAGFSEDDADRLRKAILKRTTKDAGKAKSLTDQLHDKFMEGAVKNGYPASKAESLYEDMRAFASYGFVKAHAYSYAYITYQCAFLMTYFEPEWLCSYIESMLGDPDTRKKALAEIRAMGYEVAKVDINRSGKEWEISDDNKTFYPSFQTLKGIGMSAINELLQKRPYNKLEDLIWDENGDVKHSKFNKKAMESLVKIGAFESMNLVGPDKMFESYRQLHHVIIEGAGGLKKRLKKDPEYHLNKLKQLIEESKQLPDWDRSEIVKSQIELFGSVDPDSLLTDEIRASLNEHDITGIEECKSKGVHWFILSDAKKKTAKTGRNYLLLSVFGADGSTYRMFVWSSGDAEASVLKKYACYVGQVKNDKMGFSTNLRDIREVSE